jgi:predicted HTH transcriptional regulator
MQEIHCTPSNEHKGYVLYGVNVDLNQSYQHSWWSLS